MGTAFGLPPVLLRTGLFSQRVTYTYDGDGLKRSENDGTAITTLVRDGTDVIQERPGGMHRIYCMRTLPRPPMHVLALSRTVKWGRGIIHRLLGYTDREQRSPDAYHPI